MTKNSKKGFTLVELVVVIAILAILAAIAIPVVNSIINTASKNGALSNATTIELAVKECQADIASKNTEVYPEAANASDANSIAISEVAEKKAIADAFKSASYNGKEYIPAWDSATGKCYFVDKEDTAKTIDEKSLTGTITELASSEKALTTVMVVDLKSPADATTTTT